MTTEEFSCHSTIYGNLYMTKTSQKREASIYHVWKRKSTIYGNCNHALAQLFSSTRENFLILLRDISFGRPNAYNCIVNTSKSVTLYGKTSHVERLNFFRGSFFLPFVPPHVLHFKLTHIR